MRHAAQAGTVPVDLARLGVERALLVGLSLKTLNTAFLASTLGAILARQLGLLRLFAARGFLGGFLLALQLEVLLDGFALSALGGDGLDGRQALGVGFCGGGEGVDGREFCILSASAPPSFMSAVRTSGVLSEDVGGVVVVYYRAGETESRNQALPTPALLRRRRCADESTGGKRGSSARSGAQCALAGN